MSSSRLPGKVLTELGGVPLLKLLVSRIRKSRYVQKVILATSIESSDDPIARCCNDNGIEIFRGDLNDVAGRYNSVSADHPGCILVRICGDSPFSDPEIIDGSIEMFCEDKFDIVTTSSPRTSPPGTSVEVFQSSFYGRWYPEFSIPEDFEHVTQFFYRNNSRFRIGNFVPMPPVKLDTCLTIDTPEDLVRARRLAELAGDRIEEISFRELIEFAGKF